MITLGRHSYIVNQTENTNLWPAGEVEIGNFTGVARGVQFLVGGVLHAPALEPRAVANFGFKEICLWDGYIEVGGYDKITVGHDVWIATDAMIMPGIKIGNGAIVGARAVVTRDVPAYAFVAGVPARVIRYRFNPDVIKALEALQWWNWPDEKIRENLPAMKDIEQFLRSQATGKTAPTRNG